MQRYSGEDLGPTPHIVVFGSCKVGNFVVSTPVLRALRLRFPDAVIGFVGSSVTADFEESLPQLDWRCAWDSKDVVDRGLVLQQMLAEKRHLWGTVELAINLDGFNPVTCTLLPWLQPIFVAGGSLDVSMHSMLPWGDDPQQRFLADNDWDSQDFLERYLGAFTSNYIAELFCQLAYVQGYVDTNEVLLPSREPEFDVPELLIHCTTVRSAKVWPFSRWLEVVSAVIASGWRVGLVGSSPSTQRDVYNSGEGEELLLESTSLIDLRGRTSLIQLAGACLKASAVISVDAGPLHIAAAMGTPTLAVVGNDVDGVGASPVRLWMPRSENCQRTISSHTCELCAHNRFSNNDCLVEGHPCMNGVNPQQVLDWLSPLLP